ncbi:serine hydrolase domain-containing protein [Sphingobacterium psychroaquaticum]|uniref:CubicO group peptidase, beta-lactamase class C family n=1 Tax=Sphingobacterium psychroaquaticum TaxID=561061 RepID=A0A1X7KGB0_9SPHI|nr:serine hydrolase [Sphingobacterium psychroaquaticum]SMG40180.1 CubicO group peptidase, beta-lactamase class C family [Sphingobacterium psychroaquaticum]
MKFNSICLQAVLLSSVITGNSLYAQQKSIPTNHTVLVSNQNSLLPFKRLDNLRIAVVTPFPARYQSLIETLQQYAEVASFDFNGYDEHTKYYNTIIVAGSSDELRNDLLLMAQQSAVNKKNVILLRFADKSTGNMLAKTDHNPRVTEMWSGAPTTANQREAAMSIFGGAAITEGKNRTSQTRIGYADASQRGLQIDKMTAKIDAIAAEAMAKKATPGMVVMAVKDGEVIFNKAYGSHTYAQTTPTKTTDIFDLASVSKIVGTTPVIMHLQEEKVIDLDKTMGDYLWQAKNTNKKDIPLRTVLLHEAGFTPYIPFYKSLKAGDIQSTEDAQHQVKVADNAYLVNNYYRDVMWPEMLNSPVKPAGNYVYSDISMYVMKEVAEHETATPMDEYIQEFLYRPIGMKTAGYNPRKRFDKEQIVPTEYDSTFRKGLLEGYVHDQGAAMAGGVAGHAGLFATANDLAIYGQLLLNRGTYGGVRYFKPETVDLFTSKQSKTSRRGLGFDRADADVTKEYPSKLANSSVYGHTGYTGTCLWVDPKNQLVYIFLSNRVHPEVSTRLLELNVRSRIQDAIYETINESKR